LIGWIALTGPAMGKISARNSFAKLSPDGKRLLVMVAPDAKGDQARLKPFVLPDGRSLMLRDTLGKSGCYETDTLKPVWQVEWHVFESDLQTSPDFSHVVFRNMHAFPDRVALIFYENGQEIKRYHYQELMRHFSGSPFLFLNYTDWHLQWYEDFEVKGDILTLTTIPRTLFHYNFELKLGISEHYTFDLNSGRMLSARTRGLTRFWIVIVFWILLIVVIPAGVFLRRRKLRLRAI
jgi:hypothetical protein